VIAAGKYVHACEGEMVIEGILEKVPYFNAPIYLENKTQIGKVEEIMGPIHKYLFSVKTSEGVKADSFKKDDKVCFRFVFLMHPFRANIVVHIILSLVYVLP
jgi:H/ACA ribonucleoprotein complex subunit 1